METVNIGCKLPWGMKLEVGYTVVAESPKGGVHTSVRRLPNYDTVIINGWHSRSPSGIQMPASHKPDPGRTVGVNKVLWDQWKKQHPEMIKQGLIFEYKDEADFIAKSHDVRQIRSGVEPLNPDEMPKGLAPRKDDEDKAA